MPAYDVERIRKWFDDLAERMNNDPRNIDHSWVVQVQSLLEAVFLPGHPVRTRLAVALYKVDDPFEEVPTKRALYGVFHAAHTIFDSGYLPSVIAQVQADTIGDVLDQAEDLLRRGYLIPATVLAGGALETRLCKLCEANGLAIVGDRSIFAYDQAIVRARKDGNELYDATTSKHIGAWGSMRNVAAHDPTEFKSEKHDVRRMIEGIRAFITK